jgi:transposase InsO family protein
MQQQYHLNAVTNIHIRSKINESNLSDSELSQKYDVSEATICKWKNRTNHNDKSSRPNTINYALTSLEQALILSIRNSSWLPLDEIYEMVLSNNPNASRSSVYRVLKREGVNRIPQKQREKAKKFKEYSPGYLHIDVTYLPKFEGTKYYLFVAIDRATRLMYFKVYDAKTSENAKFFMEECLDFFPFHITHVLTDNGLEFTNKLIKSKKGNLCTKPSKLDVICKENNIDHRLTKPATPQTNGMVERVNGTIKNETILKENYKDLKSMVFALNKFLVYYINYRRHGGLRRELNVKTPLQAVEMWYRLEPDIFKQKPSEFKTLFLISSKSNLLS